jgi:hypothetical protein
VDAQMIGPPRYRSPSAAPFRRLNYLRLAVTIGVGAYGLLCASNPTVYRFLDSVDLVFHESGHLIFWAFGEFVGILGGSLMQVLVPLVCTVHFLWNDRRWAATVTSFWVGQNLFNVSVYVKDARARSLPLLGGEDTIHDWYWLLGKTHLLAWDRAIGNLVYGVGLIALLACIVGGVYFSYEEELSID